MYHDAFHPGTLAVLSDWNVLFNLLLPDELGNYPVPSSLREVLLTPWNRSVTPKGVLVATCIFLPSTHYCLQLRIYMSDELIHLCPLHLVNFTIE